MKFRIIIAALALALCFGVLCACGKEDGEAKETVTGSAYTGTGETMTLPEISVPEGTGDFEAEMNKFFEEQYAEMTPEEIAQFEQDLVDLGLTKEQFYSIMYLNGGETPATTAK